MIKVGFIGLGNMGMPMALNLNKSKVEYEANKYMRAFRELFESGRTKDIRGNSIGKWYMMCLFAKANDLYYAKYDENGIPVITHKEAMARAAASMKKSLKDLNPNKAAITAKDKKTQKQQLIKSVNFLNWLDRNATDDKDKLSKGLKKLNSQYAFRYEQVKKSADEYVKSANLKKDLDIPTDDDDKEALPIKYNEGSLKKLAETIPEKSSLDEVIEITGLFLDCVASNKPTFISPSLIILSTLAPLLIISLGLSKIFGSINKPKLNLVLAGITFLIC